MICLSDAALSGCLSESERMPFREQVRPFREQVEGRVCERKGIWLLNLMGGFFLFRQIFRTIPERKVGADRSFLVVKLDS